MLIIGMQPSPRRATSVSDARQLKALEDENGRLKRLLAEAMLDTAVLKVSSDVGLSRNSCAAGRLNMLRPWHE
jgi:hypothetical protein